MGLLNAPYSPSCPHRRLMCTWYDGRDALTGTDELSALKLRRVRPSELECAWLALPSLPHVCDDASTLGNRLPRIFGAALCGPKKFLRRKKCSNDFYNAVAM